MLDSLYPRVTRRAITDRWQIKNSVMPATWTYAIGLPRIVGNLRQGIALIEARLDVMADMTGRRALVVDSSASIQVLFENGITTVGVHGSTTPDASGSGLDGRLFGVEPNGDGARFNGARNCPGFGSSLTTFGNWIEVPPTPHLASRAGGTQELWFQLEDPAVSGPLMEKDMGFGVSYDAATRTVDGHLTPHPGIFDAIASAPAIGAPGGPSATGWNHLAYTFDASSGSATIYINGVQVGSGRSSRNLLPSPLTSLYFGRAHPSDETGFSGSIRNVKVYSRALSPTEVQSAYDEAFMLPELVGWWPLSESSGRNQVAARGSGPFIVVPLSRDASRDVDLRFENLVPGHHCTLDVAGAMVPAAQAVDSDRTLHHRVVLDGSLDVTTVRIASCGM